MPSLFTHDQLKQARTADLSNYLLAHHADLYEYKNRELRPLDNHKLVIRCGHCYYYNNADHDHGNGVDYLVRYLGYSLQDAVLGLCGVSDGNAGAYAIPVRPQEQEHREIVIPPAAPDNRRVWAYLVKTRGISPDTVRKLLRQGLLYQDSRGNAVFINPAKNWGEIRGTISAGHYHRMLTGSRAAGFWYFLPTPDKPNPCFVCEAAIDAVSLYELQKRQGDGSGVYISIGGAGKQSAIDRLNNGKRQLVIATDADDAGDATRTRNPGFPTIRPEGVKDWNEQLKIMNDSNSVK